MSSKPILEHPCLREIAGDPIAAAQLTDRAKVALTLQAAGLLAHLDLAGWKLVGALEEGWVSSCGELGGLVGQPGQDETPAHHRLRRFLLALFFCETEISGRGQARRSARRLTIAWEQPLAPLTFNEILLQIFEFAPFLWTENFAYSLNSLFAGTDNDDLRVVGPFAFRLRAEQRIKAGATIQSLIADGQLEQDWTKLRPGEPADLARRRRWMEAASKFRVRAPRGEEEWILFAQCLFAIGKFEQAIEAVQGVSGVEADLLRLRSMVRLQRLGAARKQLTKIQKRRLSQESVVEVGEIALRLLFNQGELQIVRQWRTKLAKVDQYPFSLMARVALASSAYDSGDVQNAEDLLAAATELRDHPEHGWRWYNAQGLLALSLRQGRQAEKAFRYAIVGFRRRMTRVRASLLWSNLVAAAQVRGDMLAAERAAKQAYRLGVGFEGPLTTAVLLYNLVETLLRQGKVEGVRELIDAATKTDRLAGNLRALVHDVELLARYHLAQGRADRCLQTVDELLVRESIVRRRPELQAWAARALGLMGRHQEAALRLDDGGEDGLTTFDPEEIPAVWALAGDRDRARQAIEGGPFELWDGAFAGVRPDPEAWSQIDNLGPFRGARLVRDLELVTPGFVPRPHRLAAIRSFRQLGLDLHAQLLEGSTGDAWSAVTDFLDPESGGDTQALFAQAGYDDVRLEWDGPEAKILVEGRGGAERRTLSAGTGQLILDADHIDSPLRALMRLAAERIPRHPPATGSVGSHGGIIGESPALLAALERVERLARSDLPILILGETGTGKELVAKWVHQRSQRAQGPFVPVNCAAVSESLLLSDLFGHVKGAFTGAEKDRAGHFETANQGTVFLDEVGDLPFDAQGRFLRVLQESEVMRLGESRVRKVDTRVVAATHRDLTRMLEEATFRQDLFYRLHIGRVELPPLRDRGQDVILIAQYFLSQWSHDDAIFRLDGEAIAKLQRHHWPGNVRELENVLRLAAALSDSGRITAEALEFSESTSISRTDFQVEVDRFRRKMIEDALKQTGGNQAKAARSVGLTRQGLSYWIRKLGIEF